MLCFIIEIFQTKKIDITSEDQLSTETSTCPIKENLDQDYDSESDSPEEISFAKAKTDFIVISQTEKYVQYLNIVNCHNCICPSILLVFKHERLFQLL